MLVAPPPPYSRGHESPTQPASERRRCHRRRKANCSSCERKRPRTRAQSSGQLARSHARSSSRNARSSARSSKSIGTPPICYVLAAMAPARPPKSRRARPAARRAAGRAHRARPTPAERRLLELARALSALGRDARAGADALRAALERLAGAYAPGGPLTADLHRAWLESRSDKTAALALGGARGQVRLALGGLVARPPPGA